MIRVWVLLSTRKMRVWMILGTRRLCPGKDGNHNKFEPSVLH